jgi:hypothetical protein
VTITEAKKIRLRRAVRYLYDLQKLRISTGNRDTTENVELDPNDLDFMTRSADQLKLLEKQAEKEIKSILKGIPIWENWLKPQKGIGLRLGGILLAEFDITKAETVSAMWKYAGLAVSVDGKADRRKKGEKANFNPWLKSKMTKILGDSFLKSRSPWRDFYDNYKTRKQNQKVEECMACKGKGKVKSKETGKLGKCKNCAGTGGPAPWGCSDAHRHQAAIRYMSKMFLKELYVQWRTLEGLTVRPPYAEEYLGRVHHG